MVFDSLPNIDGQYIYIYMYIYMVFHPQQMLILTINISNITI